MSDRAEQPEPASEQPTVAPPTPAPDAPTATADEPIGTAEVTEPDEAESVIPQPKPFDVRGPFAGKTWIWGLGRRKTAVARVRIRPGNGRFVVNGRAFEEYFPTQRDRRWAASPLTDTDQVSTYDVFCSVAGGGPHGQADAVRLGIARALRRANPPLFERLRENGHLTRDAREKERKKYGRRGARRGFQFSKR